jgi:hypothetical protein
MGFDTAERLQHFGLICRKNSDQFRCYFGAAVGVCRGFLRFRLGRPLFLRCKNSDNSKVADKCDGGDWRWIWKEDALAVQCGTG